ncbi:MAG: FAD:protein FMN transferase [Ruminococcaceae bacterium]|nr:FAD:protein FMN transferase [Oscillospiraceae bacterium]
MLLLILCFLLGGCAPAAQKQYNAVYLDLFDTVTTIIGSGDSEEQFRQEAQKIYEQFLVYHRLFDIYNDYEGINNLKTVNDQAGIAPVKVDSAIIELLLDCKAYYELTDGKVNAAMGSVLKLWHEARSHGIENPDDAKLPDADALAQAAEHISFKSIVVDEKASTVYISDPEASLDVGAIAKGWAAQRVAENAPKGMLISVGGNVCATGVKADGSAWVVGVQNPDGGEYLRKISITGGSVVTSGDYQRTYTVDGKQYHHIIDPATGMPSTYWRSVTVVCADSALADALSTALFVLPLEEGKALAEECGAEVLWLDAEGKQDTTEEFQ